MTRLLIIIFAIIVVVIGMQIFISNNIETDVGGTPEVMPNPFSVKKISEIRKMQTAMEIFSAENGMYPPIEPGCKNFSSLKEHLVPYYIGELPEGSGSDLYKVAVSSDGWQYVLRTKVNSSSMHLASDEDGVVLGCDCNDPYYCAIEYREDEEKLRELYGE